MSNQKIKKRLLNAFLVGILSGSAGIAIGCSDFILTPSSVPPEIMTNGEIYNPAVSARTMDFTINLAWFMETQKTGLTLVSSRPGSLHANPISWQTKYKLVGFRGAHSLSKDGQYFDGMNEKGLSAALLWLDRTWPEGRRSGYPGPKEGTLNLSIKYVVNFILSQCDSVACAVSLLKNEERGPIVFGEAITFAGIILTNLPLHLVLHDANNKSAVVEWYNGKEFIYDESNKQYNPDTIRVLTNDPSFIDQTSAAREFSAVTRRNHFKESSNDITKPEDKFLPGDSSSGSRFVRLYKLNKAMGGKASECYAPEYPYSLIDTCQKPPLWRVQLANKIIARAEEVYGEYPDKNPVSLISGQDAYFHTNFTVIRDHSNQNLYVRGVYNSTLRKVSLKELFNKMDTTSKNLYQYVDPLPNGECPSTESAGIDYKLMCFQNVNSLFTESLPDQ